MREKLIELLGKVTCTGNGESLGSCPDRKYGLCGEVANLSYCVIQNIANYLIANGVTVQQWIPVTERLPDEDTRVLVWLLDSANKYTRMDTDRRHNGKWVRWEKYVTHWMPLPQPPKEG